MSADVLLTPVVNAPGELVLETRDGAFVIPRLITGEGPDASERFTEFFFANIRDKHTCQVLQFLRWLI